MKQLTLLWARLTKRYHYATFTNEHIVLDGMRCDSCNFEGCEIEYQGGALRLVGCRFIECSFLLTGAAGNTAEFIRDIAASDDSDKMRAAIMKTLGLEKEATA